MVHKALQKTKNELKQSDFKLWKNMNALVTIGLCFLGNLKIVHLPFEQISGPLMSFIYRFDCIVDIVSLRYMYIFDILLNKQQLINTHTYKYFVLC